MTTRSKSSKQTKAADIWATGSKYRNAASVFSVNVAWLLSYLRWLSLGGKNSQGPLSRAKTAKELFQSMAVSAFRFSEAQVRWKQTELDTYLP